MHIQCTYLFTHTTASHTLKEQRLAETKFNKMMDFHLTAKFKCRQYFSIPFHHT